MKRPITPIMVALAVSLQGAPAQDLFQVRFTATTTGTGPRQRITEIDIIRQMLPESATMTVSAIKADYSLVYNAVADKLQVAKNSNGALIGDVLLFSGGGVSVEANQAERLTYLFLPGRAEPIGTALITEKTPSSNQARINARLFFSLPPETVLDVATSVTAQTPFAFEVVQSNVPSTDTPKLTALRGKPNYTFYSLEGFGGNVNTATRIFAGVLTATKRFKTVPTKTSKGNISATELQDVMFVRQMAQMNLAEIRMGELIIQKAQSQAMRGFGRMLVVDHTTALAEVSALASHLGISLPTTLSATDNGTLQRLSAEEQLFDLMARQSTMQVHERGVDLCETAVKNTSNTEIVEYAQVQISVLKEHLRQDQSLSLASSGGTGAPTNGFTPRMTTILRPGVPPGSRWDVSRKPQASSGPRVGGQ